MFLLCKTSLISANTFSVCRDIHVLVLSADVSLDTFLSIEKEMELKCHFGMVVLLLKKLVLV